MYKRYNQITDEYPVVEKTIQLTDKERLAALRHGRLDASLKKALTDLLFDALTQMEFDNEVFWDAVAERFGYPNQTAVHEAGKSIQINYVTGELLLRSRATSESTKP